MKSLIGLAESGRLPDGWIRLGIRRLLRQRLREEQKKLGAVSDAHIEEFAGWMRRQPVAVDTRAANEQHYEVPADFFKVVLGRHLKYSSGFWSGDDDLSSAEARMLDLYAERAALADGMDVLELGCGWGSFSLWAAAQYPNGRFVAVSNSHSQAAFIRDQARQRGIDNLEVITEDMNRFDPGRTFDRIISVEMFEHMRNWQTLLERISHWLNPDGRLFIHIFTHRRFAYPFETDGDANWMGRHFFTGGIMPSETLMHQFDDRLRVEEMWRVDGTHYSRTANAWLRRMDDARDPIMTLMADVYGAAHARRWFHRWRIFFMACAELWGFADGRQWGVTHYRLKQT